MISPSDIQDLNDRPTEDLGMTKPKNGGWTAGDKVRRFSPDEDRIITEGRNNGLTNVALAEQLERSVDAVSRRIRILGLTAKPPKRAADRKREQVQANLGKPDADLIADFLARKAVTVCPPAHAAGITLYERETGRIARPESLLPIRERTNLQIQAQIKRRAA